jgi:hypothetical protein
MSHKLPKKNIPTMKRLLMLKVSLYAKMKSSGGISTSTKRKRLGHIKYLKVMNKLHLNSCNHSNIYQNYNFGDGKYGTDFPLMNKY